MRRRLFPTAQWFPGTSQHALPTGSKKNQSGAGVDDSNSLRQDDRVTIADTLVDTPKERGRRNGSQRTEMIGSDVVGPTKADN